MLYEILFDDWFVPVVILVIFLCTVGGWVLSYIVLIIYLRLRKQYGILLDALSVLDKPKLEQKMKRGYVSREKRVGLPPANSVALPEGLGAPENVSVREHVYLQDGVVESRVVVQFGQVKVVIDPYASTWELVTPGQVVQHLLENNIVRPGHLAGFFKRLYSGAATSLTHIP